MKTRIVLAILLIALLLVFACKKKTDNLPSDEEIGRASCRERV